MFTLLRRGDVYLSIKNFVANALGFKDGECVSFFKMFF